MNSDPELGSAVDHIWCCDAIDLLRAIPNNSVDAIITDPPYGLGGRVFEFPHHQYSAVNETWDRTVPIDWLKECERTLKQGGSVLSFAGRQSSYLIAAEGLRLGWRLVNDITWYKPNAPPNFTGRMLTETTERLLWFCPHGKNWTYNLDLAKQMNAGMNFRDLWTFGVTKGDRLHPTQKPIELIERCINLFTNPGDLIVDPFCGSGTTCLAAWKLGRHFQAGDNGIDKRTGKAWAEIALTRLANADPFQDRSISSNVIQRSLFSKNPLMQNGE